MKWIKIAVIAGLLGLLVPHLPSTRAATVVALSLEGLVSYSDISVVGTPLAMETRQDERGRIFRDVTFKIAEYVSGGGAEQIVVRLLGGTLNGSAQHVPGEIKLEMGKPVLLFLERVTGANSGIYLVTGLGQGHFNIITHDKTGLRYIARTLGKLKLIGEPGDDDPYGLARSETSTFVPMNRFLQAIRDLAGRVPKIAVPPE